MKIELAKTIRDEIARLRRKIDGIRGPGVRNGPDGIYIDAVVATAAAAPAKVPKNLLQAVYVSMNGGNNGTPNHTTPGTVCAVATYTYDVYDLAGNVLGTKVALVTARSFAGDTVPATHGMIVSGMTPVNLWSVDESRYGAAACPQT